MMLLSAQPNPDMVQSQTLLWCGVIMGAAILGFGSIMIFKKFWRQKENPGMDVGFSLSDLRAMRDRGEITPEEYEQTRANVIARVKKKANEIPKPKRKSDDESPTDLA